MQIGLLPNTEWLEGAVELSPRGEVVIDDRGQTSLPGVFAAGDCTTVPYKQIVIAMGAGSTAGAQRLRPPHPHLGSGRAASPDRGRGLGSSPGPVRRHREARPGASRPPHNGGPP